MKVFINIIRNGLIIIGFGLSISSNAQSNFIDSLISTPTKIDNNQIVHLIAYTKAGSGPLILDSSRMSVSDHTILITSFYTAWGTPLPEKSVDTFIIGKLPAGSYKLIFNMKLKVTGSTRPHGDMDSIIINVNGVNSGLVYNNKSSDSFFPNPTSGKIFFYKLSKEKVIKVYNSNGHLLDNYSSLSSDTIDLQNYRDGLYYIEIFDITKGEICVYSVLLKH